jgi:hypothetical protein
MLALCGAAESERAYAGAVGIAAKTSAVTMARPKSRWESFVLFIRTILL